jgi:hypothetical protein
MMIKMRISRLGDVLDEEVGWDAPQGTLWGSSSPTEPSFGDDAVATSESTARTSSGPLLPFGATQKMTAGATDTSF